MELTYSEKCLLAIYLEYFGKEYDCHDDRKINAGNGYFKRHIEMQNVCYLIESLNSYLGNDYGFVWNYTGPYSNGLSDNQKELDTKTEEIASFYKEYNTQTFLSEYCSSDDAKKIAFSSYVLENIMKYENGSMILAGLIYLHKTVLPVAKKERLFEELEKRFGVHGIIVNREFEEIAWLGVQIIGLAEIEKIEVEKKLQQKKQN